MEDNRFINENIVDYAEEEPKAMSQQEIVDELKRMQETNDFFMVENQDLNWQVECLEEQLTKTEKALELACEELYSDYREGYCKTPTAVYKTVCEFNGECTECKLRYFKQQAEKEVRDE